MPERVRIAVLGAGRFASEAHIPGIKAHPGAELIALYSRSREQAERVAAAVGGVPEIALDLDALLARADVDAVTVPSSDDNHYHYTMAALRAGKHVFCEKPLAVRADLAAEMAREARARNRINQVAFIFRYTYGLQHLRQLVKQGDVGEPYYVAISWEGQSDVGAGRRRTWRDSAATYGAGWISELGSHFFDTVNWVVAPVADVCAITHAIPRTVVDEQGRDHPHETSDLANVLFHTTGTAKGEINISNISPPPPGVDNPWAQVVGAKGSLYTTLTRGNGEVLRRRRPGGKWEDVRLPDEAYDGAPHAMFRMLGSYVDACLRGGIDRDQDADFGEGYQVQSALDQVVASARSRRFEPVATAFA